MSTIVHYGVLGMRWGVRRGRKTSLEKKREAKAQKAEKRYKKRIEEVRKKNKKFFSSMSEAEKEAYVQYWIEEAEKVKKLEKELGV